MISPVTSSSFGAASSGCHTVNDLLLQRCLDRLRSNRASLVMKFRSLSPTESQEPMLEELMATEWNTMCTETDTVGHGTVSTKFCLFVFFCKWKWLPSISTAHWKGYLYSLTGSSLKTLMLSSLYTRTWRLRCLEKVRKFSRNLSASENISRQTVNKVIRLYIWKFSLSEEQIVADYTANQQFDAAAVEAAVVHHQMPQFSFLSPHHGDAQVPCPLCDRSEAFQATRKIESVGCL